MCRPRDPGGSGSNSVVPTLFLEEAPNVVVVPTLFLVEQRGAHDLIRHAGRAWAEHDGRVRAQNDGRVPAQHDG